MRTILWPMVAVTLISALGNAQDDAVPVSTAPVSPAPVPTAPVSTGYAAQGNVAMNKAQHEAEMQLAVQEARQQRALKEAMAAYAQKPPVITTPEQFLAVHRPPAPQPREGDQGMSPGRTSPYVPAFQTTASRVNSSAPPAADPVDTRGDLPERKPGLFDLFRSKKKAPVQADPSLNPHTLDAPAPPPASSGAPTADGAAAPEGRAATMAEQGAAIAAATASPALSGPSEEKPDFFGRLFGKGRKNRSTEAAVPAQDNVGTAPPAPETPSVTVTVAPATEAGGIPTPPAFTEGAPTTPAPGPGAVPEN